MTAVLFRWGLLLGLIAALAGPGAGAAQTANLSQTLEDGRTLVVAPETEVCGRPSPYDDNRFAISVQFDCRDAISGVSGSVFLGVAEQPGETTPREYLEGIAEDYWPDLSPSERAAQIETGTAEFSGVSVEVVCVAASDSEATIAHAACVLSQPRTQVIMHMRSTGVPQALGVLAMALTGMAIR